MQRFFEKGFLCNGFKNIDHCLRGAPVDMMSEEYEPAIDELMRTNTALYRVNHTEPGNRYVSVGAKDVHQYRNNLLNDSGESKYLCCGEGCFFCDLSRDLSVGHLLTAINI